MIIKPREWIVEIDRKMHNIKFTFNANDKDQILLVDGCAYRFTINHHTVPRRLDFPFMIEDHELHLVIVGGSIDLSLDEKFLDHKCKYQPIKSIFRFGWATVIYLLYCLTYVLFLFINGATFFTVISILFPIVGILITAVKWMIPFDRKLQNLRLPFLCFLMYVTFCVLISLV